MTSSPFPACRRDSTRGSRDARSRRAAISRNRAALPSVPNSSGSAKRDLSACHFASLGRGHRVNGSAENGGPLLEVEDLVVRYRIARGSAARSCGGRSACACRVRRLTGVARGEMVALVGESGCGKTTTAQAILRLVEAESGSVSFDGVDVTDLSQGDLRALRRRMQIIYQDPYESLDPRFRVSATVAEPLVIHGIGSRSERRVAVSHALEQVGLAPAELFADRYPHAALRRPAPARRHRREPRPWTGTPCC